MENGLKCELDRLFLDTSRHNQILQNFAQGTDKESIAISAAGVIPYYCKCEVIDTYSLNSLNATHGNRTASDVLNQRPEYILLNDKGRDRYTGSGLEAQIYRSERFQRNYQLVRIESSAAILQFTNCHPGATGEPYVYLVYE